MALNEITEIYNDIEIQVNEKGIIEIGFKTEHLASKFVSITTYFFILICLL